jgi:hypothetical protein
MLTSNDHAKKTRLTDAKTAIIIHLSTHHKVTTKCHLVAYNYLLVAWFMKSFTYTWSIVKCDLGMALLNDACLLPERKYNLMEIVVKC